MLQIRLFPMKQSLINEITDVLQKVPLVTNLARKKFVAQFVIGLIKSRNIQFCEVAQHLNDQVKIASNENRIQDFFREVSIDYYSLATLLLALIPKEKKLRVCIDRTEWDFGSCQVNILMILVGYKDFHIPFFWKLLGVHFFLSHDVNLLRSFMQPLPRMQDENGLPPDASGHSSSNSVSSISAAHPPDSSVDPSASAAAEPPTHWPTQWLLTRYTNRLPDTLCSPSGSDST